MLTMELSGCKIVVDGKGGSSKENSKNRIFRLQITKGF